jgi:3-deoxy-D-manno-octulosonic-acid transferase
VNRVFTFLYGLLMWAVQPLLRIKLARRGKAEPGYLEAVEERFGHYTVAAQQGMVWVHAVSLGETRAAAVLIAALRKRLPGMRLLLTHGTATGRAEGRNLLKPGDLQVWQPWDAPGAVDRFLAHFKPSVGVLMETEIWPRLCAACAEQRVPLVLANARLSEKSLNSAQSAAVLMVPAYQALAAAFAQTESDATRLRLVEAPVQGVFGNLKFDATPDAALLARGQEWRALWSAVHGRRIALFASSREGEEAALLQLLQRVQAVPSSLQWLIVPRHPQRFDEVAALIEQHGFAVSRRRTWTDSAPIQQVARTIWLGDSLGEMAMYYGLADVALLGGSFERLGGQNLIEAAACGCPVVMGPHTFNFLEAAKLAESAGAALRATDLADAVRIAERLTSNPLERDAAVQASLSFAASHRGAAARTADAIVGLVPRPNRQ